MKKILSFIEVALASVSVGTAVMLGEAFGDNAGTVLDANPDDITVEMFRATAGGAGDPAGTVVISKGPGGLLFRLALGGMKPFSMHGLHIHENASCAPLEKNGKKVPALSAGGHWDPEKTGFHAGPAGSGHRGDLPRIEADAKGRIDGTISVPHLDDLDELKGHALIMHAGADNYSDKPKKLGGGGPRLFCGIIRK